MRSFMVELSPIVLTALMMIGAGCPPHECIDNNGDRLDFTAGDRCPLLIDGGALEFAPASVSLPPAISAADAPGGQPIEPSQLLTIRGWVDPAMSNPAVGYMVYLSLGPCEDEGPVVDRPPLMDGEVPTGAAVESQSSAAIPLAGHLALAELPLDTQPCEHSSDYLIRCALDAKGQASVRVLSGPMLTMPSTASEAALCVWAHSGGIDLTDENKKEDGKLHQIYVRTRRKAEVRVAYNVQDLDLAVTPVLATPLACGTAETPCLPVTSARPTSALCTSGDTCADLSQFVRVVIASQYHGSVAALGQDLPVTLNLTGDAGSGRRWLTTDDCTNPPITTTTLDAETGRSPELLLCSDGGGGTARLHAQSPSVPGLTASLHARFAPAPARLSDVTLLSGGDDDMSATFRVTVTDCNGAGLPAVTMKGSLDGGQRFGSPAVSDAVGACLLTVAKDIGPVPGTLLLSLDEWGTECSLTVP